MNWSQANEVVEQLRKDTRLYLPALSHRRGFSSSRVEWLLNGLVQRMPETEYYLEVGTLEGRTLEAAAAHNHTKAIAGCDPCTKYDVIPDFFPPNVLFVKGTWQDVLNGNLLPLPIGCAFYDAGHSADDTFAFMDTVRAHMADEAILVLDDWDRETVRDGAFRAVGDWQLLREMPEYTDGLSTVEHSTGYYFGVAVWGFRR